MDSSQSVSFKHNTMKEQPSTKTLINNIWSFLSFGKKLYDRGICDKPMNGAYNYTETCETKGYNKEEASNLLGLSVRQFDRRIKFGLINKGRKYRDDSRLYWDKAYINRLSDILKK